MEAFNEIYSQNYNRVFSWCRSKLNNVESAEELTTDIFIKVHKNLTEYDAEKSTLSTWIMNITKNAIIDFWRTNKKHGLQVSITEFEDDEGHDMLHHTDGLTPQSEMENNELGEAIMNAIVELPSNYQTVIDMFLIEQKSHEEISVALDMPMGSVKGAIHRAKKMLQKRLTNL